MRIIANRLRVSGFNGLKEFYCGALGMHDLSEGSARSFGYDCEDARLEFHQSDISAYSTSQQDFYWKTGITVDNLDATAAWLTEQGMEVSPPRQFRDIGYLAHITDPFGFPIELLQKGFEGNHKPANKDDGFGAQSTIAHITLRVTDLTRARTFFEHDLGMRLISVQPVMDFNFTLYFYCWSDEELPEPDPHSVNNREWLWHRPYTLIELQHIENAGSIIRPGNLAACGFDGFDYQDSQTGKIKQITISQTGTGNFVNY